MISPEELERIVQQYDQEAHARGATGRSGVSRSETMKVTSATEINGRTVELVATPLEITNTKGRVLAKRFRVEQKREDIGTQTREIIFEKPVLVTGSAICLNTPQTRWGRLPQNKLPEFDLSWVFSGSKDAIKSMKDWGVKKPQ